MERTTKRSSLSTSRAQKGSVKRFRGHVARVLGGLRKDGLVDRRCWIELWRRPWTAPGRTREAGANSIDFHHQISIKEDGNRVLIQFLGRRTLGTTHSYHLGNGHTCGPCMVLGTWGDVDAPDAPDGPGWVERRVSRSRSRGALRPNSIQPVRQFSQSQGNSRRAAEVDGVFSSEQTRYYVPI